MNTLLVILGPTGVGKTEFALCVAQQFGTEIVNCDSRQVYKQIPIGTAAPTPKEQQRVKHWFVGNKDITDEYNAAQYETDALNVINELFQNNDIVVLTGGSMMYIDAVCKGLDMLPQIDPAIRQKIVQQYQMKGLLWLQQETRRLDPQYFTQVDINNPQRLIHAIEVSIQAGVPYSTLLSGKKTKRDFKIVKVGLFRDREELYQRINLRVIKMFQDGLEEEARAVYHLKGLNSLNTVGYKELFQYFDGDISREQAVLLIQQHSRNYAKRQMTWWHTPRPLVKQSTIDTDIHWLDAASATAKDIIKLI